EQVHCAISAQKGGRVSSSRSSSTRSSSSSSTSKPKGTATKSSSTKLKGSSVPKKSTVATRNKNGKIQRSTAARKEFMRLTGYPNGRKGYIVDHVVPLECRGADVPANLQWQTAAEAKIKDRTERIAGDDGRFAIADANRHFVPI